MHRLFFLLLRHYSQVLWGNEQADVQYKDLEMKHSSSKNNSSDILI